MDSATVAAGADEGDADIGESRRDRRVWLVDRDLDLGNTDEAFEDGLGHHASCGFHQLVTPRREGAGRGLGDRGIRDGIGEFVGIGRVRQIERQLDIEDESLPDAGLVAATLSACTVSATS